MNLNMRFIKLIGLVGVFALCTLLVFPLHSASAASSCQTAPSEANCTGKDPQVTGCENDAYTITTAEVTGTVRAAVRYSPTCKSAWGRGVNLTTLSGSTITGEALRSDGYATARLAYYPTTAITSNMVYIGNGLSVKAIATLQNSAGQVVSQVQTGYVRP